MRAVVQRAALLHDEHELRPEHLPAELRSSQLFSAVSDRSADSSSDAIAPLAAVELEYIRRVLALCHGNRTVAAQRLGITRQTLSKKVGASGDEE